MAPSASQVADQEARQVGSEPGLLRPDRHLLPRQWTPEGSEAGRDHPNWGPDHQAPPEGPSVWGAGGSCPACGAPRSILPSEMEASLVSLPSVFPPLDSGPEAGLKRLAA